MKIRFNFAYTFYIPIIIIDYITNFYLEFTNFRKLKTLFLRIKNTKRSSGFRSNEFHGKFLVRPGSSEGRRTTSLSVEERKRQGENGKRWSVWLLIFRQGDLHARALKFELLATKSGAACRMVSERDTGRRKCSVAKRTRCLSRL